MMGNLRGVGHRLRCPTGGDEQPQGDGAVEEVSHGPGRSGGFDAQYHPFTWREFIAGRTDDNYADLGVDDIQIDRFRVA
jgi:hypothetical protein